MSEMKSFYWIWSPSDCKGEDSDHISTSQQLASNINYREIKY